jgi:hypothetical protein
MKPFYNLGYREAMLTFLRPAVVRNRRFLATLGIISLVSITCVLLLAYQYQFLIILLLFAVGVASMLHMRYAQWLGAIDLNLLITVYVSMKFGFPAGFFVSHAEIVGLILAGDIDNNLLYDLLASYFVAFAASLFALGLFVPVVTILAILYCISGMIYHYFAGTLHFANSTWYITNILWVMFLIHKLLPLFSRFIFNL